MGLCLGTGIVDDDKAAAVAAHLVGPLLNSGFEVRTLATDMKAFTPMSYHNGSVWPHDTAIAIKGLANYSFVERDATRLRPSRCVRILRRQAARAVLRVLAS